MNINLFLTLIELLVAICKNVFMVYFKTRRPSPSFVAFFFICSQIYSYNASRFWQLFARLFLLLICFTLPSRVWRFLPPHPYLNICDAAEHTNTKDSRTYRLSSSLQLSLALHAAVQHATDPLTIPVLKNSTIYLLV